MVQDISQLMQVFALPSGNNNMHTINFVRRLESIPVQPLPINSHQTSATPSVIKSVVFAVNMYKLHVVFLDDGTVIDIGLSCIKIKWNNCQNFTKT